MSINNIQMIKVNEVDTNILDNAIEAFFLETDFQWQVGARKVLIDDQRFDAVLNLQDEKFIAEIKKWAQQANFGALVHQIKRLPGNGLLVADYVNRKMAARLKEAEIQFIDTAGNAYIKQHNLYVNIRGNEPRQGHGAAVHQVPYAVHGAGTGRAFTQTGLKVVYAILKEPALVKAPYRKIAEYAGVALGTVGWVLNDLKAQGLIVERKEKKQLQDYGILLDRWIEAYPLRLRKKQIIGTFTHLDPYWWQHFEIKKCDAQWGGEIAAALLTNYLKPIVGTIYLRGPLTKLVQEARLTKKLGDEGVMVEVLTPFWPELVDEGKETVCPLIVYADLINTANPRNLETAQLIYEQHIDQYFRKA